MAGLTHGNAQETDEDRESGPQGMSLRWVIVSLGIGVVLVNIAYLAAEALRG